MHRRWPRGLLAPGLRPPRRPASRGNRRRHLERRKGQIEAQIASINARDNVAQRKRETRANIVLGAVIRSHTALNPAFVPALVGILMVALRRRADRELLASVLGLPQLVGGDEEDTLPKLQSGTGSPDVPRPTSPQRPGLMGVAVEITVRRRVDVTADPKH
jgi:hypothetical protein